MNDLVKIHLEMLTAVLPGCNLRLVMTLSQFLSVAAEQMCKINRTTGNAAATNPHMTVMRTVNYKDFLKIAQW